MHNKIYVLQTMTGITLDRNRSPLKGPIRHCDTYLNPAPAESPFVEYVEVILTEKGYEKNGNILTSEKISLTKAARFWQAYIR